MPPLAIELRPDRRDAHLVGQRRLEPVEQLGPRERAPVDQVVGLPRFGRRELELAADRRSRAAAPPPSRSSAARASSRDACVRQLRVAARVANDARHVERRGATTTAQRDEQQPGVRPRARCRTGAWRGWCGSCRHRRAVSEQQADERRQRVEQRRRRGDAIGQRRGRARIDASRPASPAAPRGCGGPARRRPLRAGVSAGAGQDDRAEARRPSGGLRSTSPSGARGRPACRPRRPRGCGRRSGAGRAAMRDRGVVGRDVHEQPVAGRRARCRPARR